MRLSDKKIQVILKKWDSPGYSGKKDELTGADLYGANLTGAYLSGAYLYGANLTRAYLSGAYLTGANLTGAYLTRADLSGANLTGAYLSGAYLTGANLTGANLTDVKNAESVIARTRILPEGDIIGYKKASDGSIVKLLVPAKAKRSHAFGRKCRAEFAEVLEIITRTGRPVKSAHSRWDHTFVYNVGKIVRPIGGKFDDDDWMKECAPGIHFFITRVEAEEFDD
jgi:hypothetical protein